MALSQRIVTAGPASTRIVGSWPRMAAADRGAARKRWLPATVGVESSAEIPRPNSGAEFPRRSGAEMPPSGSVARVAGFARLAAEPAARSRRGVLPDVLGLAVFVESAR